MATRKRVVREPEEPADEQPIVTPAPTTAADPGAMAEYEIDGMTYLLTAADAKRRGAKAVSTPANKAVTPTNK